MCIGKRWIYNWSNLVSGSADATEKAQHKARSARRARQAAKAALAAERASVLAGWKVQDSSSGMWNFSLWFGVACASVLICPILVWKVLA